MAEREMILAVVNCNSAKEADRIGRACLKKRLCACYNLIPRIKSTYHWPPRSNKLETAKGPILTMDTLPKHYTAIIKIVKRLHSDKVPFIGQWEIENVEKNFYNWLRGEIIK